MNNETKRYYVNFYDMIDGWGDFGFFSENLFDDLDLAIKLCDKLNSELDRTNKECGEHFGVIDGVINREIYCGMDEKHRTNILATIENKKQENIKQANIGDIDWDALEDYWAKRYEEDYLSKK